MKKLTVILALFILTAVFFIGCDKQKGLEQALQNPDSKKYIMGVMMEDESIKTEMAEYLLADTIWVDVIVNRLSEQIDSRELMFEKLMEHEGMADIMLEKMAEDPDLVKKMKDIGRRK